MFFLSFLGVNKCVLWTLFLLWDTPQPALVICPPLQSLIEAQPRPLVPSEPGSRCVVAGDLRPATEACWVYFPHLGNGENIIYAYFLGCL